MDFEYVLEINGKMTEKKGEMEIKGILKELNEKIGNNGKTMGQ